MSGQMDVKREEFRKYLEKEGVLEYLTKQLVRLYEEADKPANALDYLKNNFNSKDNEVVQLKIANLEKEKRQDKETIEKLKSEKSELEKKVRQLEKELAAGESTSSNNMALAAETNKRGSDGDEPMETVEDKPVEKTAPKQNNGDSLPLESPTSPLPTSEDKESSVEKTEDTPEATDEKMETENKKARSEGEGHATPTADTGAEIKS